MFSRYNVPASASKIFLHLQPSTSQTIQPASQASQPASKTALSAETGTFNSRWIDNEESDDTPNKFVVHQLIDATILHLFSFEHE
jgi:hypothetical protein